MNSSTIICLMGPTAAGKTDLALELCRLYPCEIISVDSVMIYRDMDIGTGKPDKKILAAIPHHLIDIRDASETYSAADFCQDALKIIPEILARKKIPLLVGGTMLYFKALLQGLDELPNTDEVIRQKLLDEYEGSGLNKLYERLQQIDPKAAAKIHPNDPQRILRALEVYEISGTPISEWQKQKPAQFPYPYIQLGLAPEDRTLLHQKIAQRFENMLAQGFLTEVEKLFAREDLSLSLPALRSVGYRQAWLYLAGEYDFSAMKEKAIAATRQLAKRQLTWLRTWPNLQWLNPQTPLSEIKVLLS